MTRDPERLLSSASAADPLERELLSSLRDECAPSDARRAVWQGIAAGITTLAPASAAAAASGTVAPAAASGIKLGQAALLLVAKWALVGALGAGAVGGAVWVAARGAKPEPVLPARPSAPVVPRAAEVPQPKAAEPAPSAAPAPSKRPHMNALLAESALLQTARAQLRSGALADTERTLAQLQRRFPRGVLGQERDVLRIELLRARGEHAAAERAVQSFLRSYPESPHAAQLSAP
jgi:hypothetical protein